MPRTPFVSMAAAPASPSLVARRFARIAATPFRRLCTHFWRLLRHGTSPQTQCSAWTSQKNIRKKKTARQPKATGTKDTRPHTHTARGRSAREDSTHPATAETPGGCRHPDAAGIDIGARELVAAVPPGRGARPVRTFDSFTSGVLALRDWLLECGVKTAAPESTGTYWVTTYAVFEDAGIEGYLVNARHVKGVPGRKTDVCDAQWLQQLHTAGLLKKSFRPHKDIVPLRYLMRHRAELIGEAARQLLLAQKVLTEMNLHIHHVFSDLDGESAQRIVEAILAGERDAVKLAALRDSRCRTPVARVLAALQGDYRGESLFVLNQCQERRAQIAAAIAACDAEIAQLSAKVCGDASGPAPAAPAAARTRTARPPPSAKKPGVTTAWTYRPSTASARARSAC